MRIQIEKWNMDMPDTPDYSVMANSKNLILFEELL